MVLPTTTPDGSSYRKIYSGPVDVSGTGVTQSFDISDLPEPARRDPSFEDDWLVFVQPSLGISNVSPNVSFVRNLSGLPVAFTLTLDSDNPSNHIDVVAWFLHSVVR